MVATFDKSVNKTDMGMDTTATNVSIVAGRYTQIGSLTTGAQQINFWGSGVIANGVDSRKYGTMTLNTPSGALTNTSIRLAVQDANGINTTPVLEDLYSNWNTASTVRVGLSQPGAKEDSKLLILANPNVTTQIDFGSTTTAVNIPITRVFLG